MQNYSISAEKPKNEMNIKGKYEQTSHLRMQNIMFR